MKWARPLLRIWWCSAFVAVLGAILFTASSVIAIPGADAVKGWKYFGGLALAIIVLPVALGFFLAYKSAMMAPESQPTTGEISDSESLRTSESQWGARILRLMGGILGAWLLFYGAQSGQLIFTLAAIIVLALSGFPILKGPNSRKRK